MLHIISIEEPFHGCKETFDFFLELIKNCGKKVIYIAPEMLTPTGATYLNKYKIYDKKITRGLMLKKLMSELPLEILDRVKFVGFESETRGDRLKNIRQNIIDTNINGTVYYYGFHIGNAIETCVNDKLLKHIKLTSIVSISPKMRAFVADTSNEKNHSFVTESKVYKLADVEKYYPPTELELSFKGKQQLIKVTSKMKGQKYRVAGIWFSYPGKHYQKISIANFILYIPFATYLSK